MNKDEFLELSRMVFQQSQAGSGEMMEWVWTNDGVMAIASDDTGRIGFGVAAGLRPTTDLLAKVSTLN